MAISTFFPNIIRRGARGRAGPGAPGPPALLRGAHQARPGAATCGCCALAGRSGRPRGLGAAAGPGRAAHAGAWAWNAGSCRAPDLPEPGERAGQGGRGPRHQANCCLGGSSPLLYSYLERSDRPFATRRLQLGVDNSPRTRPGGGGGGGAGSKGAGSRGAGVGASAPSLPAPGPRPPSPGPRPGPSAAGVLPGRRPRAGPAGAQEKRPPWPSQAPGDPARTVARDASPRPLCTCRPRGPQRPGRLGATAAGAA